MEHCRASAENHGFFSTASLLASESLCSRCYQHSSLIVTWGCLSSILIMLSAFQQMVNMIPCTPIAPEWILTTILITDEKCIRKRLFSCWYFQRFFPDRTRLYCFIFVLVFWFGFFFHFTAIERVTDTINLLSIGISVK